MSSNVFDSCIRAGTWRDRFISVHVTDLCNERCDFCVVSSPFFSQSEVRDDDMWDFVAEYSRLGYSSANLHGGEPTVYPRLLDLLDHLRSNGYAHVAIQTNARRLRDEAFARRVVAHGVHLFVISLHSAVEAVHDELTSSPGAWRDAVAGIRNVKRLGVPVRTNIVLTAANVRNLAEYVELLMQLDVDHVNISHMHPVGSAYLSFPTHIVDLDATRQAVEALTTYLVRESVPVTLEGFPACAVGDLVGQRIESRARDVPLLWKGRVLADYDRFMDEGRIKHPLCGFCIHDRSCGGVYREYVRYLGWKGLAPVRPDGSPIPVPAADFSTASLSADTNVGSNDSLEPGKPSTVSPVVFRSKPRVGR